MIIQRGGDVCVRVCMGGGGDEIEWRMERRPGSGEKLSSFHFHFLFISQRAEPCVEAFHADRCQISDPEPDGVDQTGYGNTI